MEKDIRSPHRSERVMIMEEARHSGALPSSSAASTMERAHRPPPTQAETQDTAMSEETKDRINKQSFEYVVRSGFAGGIAGCAVRLSF